MASRHVLLDVARFLDAPQALALSSLPTEEIRHLATALLACAYEDLGKKPRFLDGEDARLLARELLPRRLRVSDPAVDALPAVVDAYLSHLEETELVPHAFELRRALEEALPDTVALVRAGANTTRTDTGPAKPVVHRAPKLGRNDPCFCGSGKKFKKCHGRPG